MKTAKAERQFHQQKSFKGPELQYFCLICWSKNCLWWLLSSGPRIAQNSSAVGIEPTKRFSKRWFNSHYMVQYLQFRILKFLLSDVSRLFLGNEECSVSSFTLATAGWGKACPMGNDSAGQTPTRSKNALVIPPWGIGDYLLVMTNIAVENHHVEWEQSFGPTARPQP